MRRYDYKNHALELKGSKGTVYTDDKLLFRGDGYIAIKMFIDKSNHDPSVVKIFKSHDKNNIKKAGIAVYSSAIKDDNPEITMAKKLSIPLVHRSEMLGELMRLKQSIAIAGTHG